MNDRPSIIVIGGSAGAIDALLRLVPKIPAAMPARLFVAVHVPATATSALPAILARAGRLPARHPSDGDETQPGVLYVAPPDHHLLVKRATMRVVRGPRENGHRPAIDPLFRSAAASHGSRVIAVVLSGNLDDGAAGAHAVAAAGGRVIVQHPDDSPYPSMPLSTLASTPTAEAVPLADIAAQLVRMLSSSESEVDEMPSDRARREPPPDPVELDAEASEAFTRQGKASGIACPECNGGIFELNIDGVPHYRCRVGHAYSADSLYLEQRASLETALWTALRALEESAELAHRLVSRSTQRGNLRAADSFRHNADVYTERAELIRGVLRNGLPLVGESEQPPAAH
jgi:two-component system, chemotaxis family, protein-glutamate methylesterase/glutaminase